MFPRDASPPGNGDANETDPTTGAALSPLRNIADSAERITVPDDTDGLTKATVAKMGDYIRAASTTPVVTNAAHYAVQRMGRGQYSDPAACAWSVFWFLKHRVRRVLDEGNMFRVGEPGAYDMLIAPEVLLQMQNPAEDCDGFTMAAAAMLQALGVPNCIVTVACDPREPQRWSHVFGMVQLPDGRWIPLDCSHADAPGQFPRGLPQRVSRWQAWDLNGNPIDVQMPAVASQFRGYTRRGMGQDDPTGTICGDGSMMDANGVCGGSVIPSGPIPTLGPIGAPIGSTTPSGGINWAGLIPALAADATRVASIAELPAGYSLSANGSVVPNVSSMFGSILPILMLGLGAVLIINLVGSAGKR